MLVIDLMWVIIIDYFQVINGFYVSILIPVVYGWEHVSWNAQYYPDDLPAEWRFSYFANEHAGVIIPVSVWTNADSDVIEEWFDDADANFAFVIEFDGTLEGLGHLQVAFADFWERIDALYCAEDFAQLGIDEKPILSSSALSQTQASLVNSEAVTAKEWGPALKAFAQLPSKQVFIWVKAAERTPKVLEDVQTLVGFL